MYCSSQLEFEDFASSISGVITNSMSAKPFGIVLALNDTTVDGNWLPLSTVTQAELSLFGNPEDAAATVTAYFSFSGKPYIPEIMPHEVEVFEAVIFGAYDDNDFPVPNQDAAKTGQLKLIWS